MKKLAVIFIGMFLFTSCTERGEVVNGDENGAYPPCIVKNDTIDFYQYAPFAGGAIWGGIKRSGGDVNLCYRAGKTSMYVAIVDGSKKSPKLINGVIVSENDSIVVIKKNK